MDRYQRWVNSPLGSALAGRVGLPQPAVLRRYHPDDPLLAGPLLLGGTGLDGLAALLAEAGAEVQAEPSNDRRWAALVYDATALRDPAGLVGPREFLHGSLRRLGPSGRVVLLGRAPQGVDPEAAAAQQALDGLIRSLAKELRDGATANLIQLESEQVELAGPLRFLLSGRSAYLDGQVLRVQPGPAAGPADWRRPLAGKQALVTGAARGIGAAIASTLARDGASVVLADLPAAGQALAEVANRIGGSTLQLDIAAPAAADRLAEYLIERHGGVDIVVHNAGITRDRLLVNMSAQQWDSVLAVNLQAQLAINQRLLADQTLRPAGRVVCLASTSGIAGNRGQTNYAASKAGVIGMVRASAPAFAERQATINAVAPGFIDTEMTRSMPAMTREVARRLSSLRQAGQPVDVAETVAFLSQSAAGGLTGQVLRVCGQNLVGA